MRRALLIALLLVACGGNAPPAQVAQTSGSAKPADGNGNADTSRQRVATLGAAAATWRSQHKGACPTFVSLCADGPLDPSFPAFDGWGNDMTISCTATDTRIVSAGPDGKPGDADDIVDARPVPPRDQGGPGVPRAYGEPPRTHLPPTQPTAAPAVTDDPYAQARADLALGVQQCFQRAMQAEPTLTGQVKLTAAGPSCEPKVTLALTPPDSPALPALTTCIAAAARAVRYACAVDAGAPLASPFTFTAGH
jgi:hypothetical protein